MRIAGKVFARGARADVPSSLVAVDGKEFVTTEDGRAFVLKAEYELLHVNRPADVCQSCMVDGNWSWRISNKLVCIAAPSGK